jgi:acyl dehydratase
MPASRPIGTIPEGFRSSRRYVITKEIQAQFLGAFEDTNSLHVDDTVARQRGFPERIMHGMILHGFISHFVGVHFPGDGSLLQSVSTQFKSPCHLGDEILIEATVVQIVESVRVIVLDLVLSNVTRGRIAAKAKVQVGVP